MFSMCAATPNSPSLSAEKYPSHWVSPPSSGRPLFRNPWPSADPPGWKDLLQVPVEWQLKVDPEEMERLKVKVVKPDWLIEDKDGNDESDGSDDGKGKGGGRPEKEALGATWLGHSSYYLQLPSSSSTRRPIHILFDPIFSTRASPHQSAGPSRIRPPPCEIKDLPQCDAVCISHNHYDHLDLDTILTIKQYFPEAVYFVPLCNKDWFIQTGIDSSLIFEMDWWQETTFEFKSVVKSESVGEGIEIDSTKILFACVPAQHHSGRGVRDHSTTLWCGWVLKTIPDEPKGKSLTVYNAGDTGYRSGAHHGEACPVFLEIGDKYGPMDLSMIPIWRGGSLSFVSWFGFKLTHHRFISANHALPPDALWIHSDVRSRRTLAMHFGTFVGSEEEAVEPLIWLEEERCRRGIGYLNEGGGKEVKEGGKTAEERKLGGDWRGEFGSADIGETRKWWLL